MAALISSFAYSGTTNFTTNVGELYLSSTDTKQEKERFKIELKESVEVKVSSYFLRIHVLVIIIGSLFLIQLLLSLLGLWKTNGAIGLVGTIAFLGLSRISGKILTKARDKSPE